MRESEVTQSCLTLSDPMDCNLLGSSIHGIFQARVLEWGAIAFSSEDNRREKKQPRNTTRGRCGGFQSSCKKMKNKFQKESKALEDFCWEATNPGGTVGSFGGLGSQKGGQWLKGGQREGDKEGSRVLDYGSWGKQTMVQKGVLIGDHVSSLPLYGLASEGWGKGSRHLSRSQVEAKVFHFWSELFGRFPSSQCLSADRVPTSWPG